MLHKFFGEGLPMNNHAQHLDHDWILERAAGTLDPCLELVVDTHTAICHTCRGHLDRAHEISLEILAAMGEPLPQTKPQLCMHDNDNMSAPGQNSLHGDASLPGNIRAMLSMAPLKSRKIGPVEETTILESSSGYKARVLKIAAGAKIPSHTHEGEEVTLVLAGGYTDDGIHFTPGDISLADERINHAPVADDDGPCYVLAVNLGSIKLTGRLGRHLNSFIRF
ncbi:MAG TPA: hypothetical protein DHV03_06190 [Alphaproteobacteria bacterium]|nr:hypothetical protein [Alphaproteobacteria bacterium]